MSNSKSSLYKKISIWSLVIFLTLGCITFIWPNNIVDIWTSGLTRSSWLVNFMAATTDIYYVHKLYIFLIISFIIFGRALIAAEFALSVGITAFLTSFFKDLFGRSRPDEMLYGAGGFSYPSGHTSSIVVVCFFLILFVLSYIKSKLLRVISITAILIFGLIISLGRVILNVHFVLDILGGVALAIGVSMAVIHLLSKYK